VLITTPYGFDPILSAVEFSFKVLCPSEFDCLCARVCPPEQAERPENHYLAKDYASFRQIMLDRMALLMPEWRERSPADLGVLLVELLAYAADHLSYQQDAVATEAYLGTARRRVSVKRHAASLNYFMHDGCNAVAGCKVKVDGSEPVRINKGTKASYSHPRTSVRIPEGDFDPSKILTADTIVFETMHEVLLCNEHNKIPFYNGGREVLSSCWCDKGDPGGALSPVSRQESSSLVEIADARTTVSDEAMLSV